MDAYNVGFSDSVDTAKMLYRFVLCELKESKLKYRILTMLNLRAEVEQYKILFNLLGEKKLMVSRILYESKEIAYSNAIDLLRRHFPAKVQEFVNTFSMIYKQTSTYCDAPARIKGIFESLGEAINSLLERTAPIQLFTNKADAYQHAASASFTLIMNGITEWLTYMQLNLKVKIKRVNSLLQSMPGATVDEIDYDKEAQIRATEEFINAPITDIDEIEDTPLRSIKEEREKEKLTFMRTYKLNEFVFDELPESTRKFQVCSIPHQKVMMARQRKHEREARDDIDDHRDTNTVSELVRSLMQLHTAFSQKGDIKKAVNNLQEILVRKRPSHTQIEWIQGSFDVAVFIKTLASSLTEDEYGSVLNAISTCILLLLISNAAKRNRSFLNKWTVFGGIVALTVIAFFYSTEAYSVLSSNHQMVTLLMSLLIPSSFIFMWLLYDNSSTISDLFSNRDNLLDKTAKYRRLGSRFMSVIFSKTTDSLNDTELENAIKILKSLSEDDPNNIWASIVNKMSLNVDTLKLTLSNPNTKHELMNAIRRIPKVTNKMKKMLDWRTNETFGNYSYSTQSMFLEIQQYDTIDAIKRTDTFVDKTNITEILRLFINTPYAFALTLSSLADSLIQMPLSKDSVLVGALHDYSFWTTIISCVIALYASGAGLLKNSANRRISTERVSLNYGNINTLEDYASLKTDSLWYKILSISDSVRESRYMFVTLLSSVFGYVPNSTLNKLVKGIIPQSKNSMNVNLLDSVLSIAFCSSLVGILSNTFLNTSYMNTLPGYIATGGFISHILIPGILDYSEGTSVIGMNKGDDDAMFNGNLSRLFAAGQHLLTSIATTARISALILPYSQQLNILESNYYWSMAAMTIMATEVGSKGVSNWCSRKQIENNKMSLEDIKHHIYYVVQCIALVWADINGTAGDELFALRIDEFVEPSDNVAEQVNEWVLNHIVGFNETTEYTLDHFNRLLKMFYACIDKLKNILTRHKNAHIKEFNSTYTFINIANAFTVLRRSDVIINNAFWMQTVVAPFFALIPSPSTERNTYMLQSHVWYTENRFVTVKETDYYGLTHAMLSSVSSSENLYFTDGNSKIESYYLVDDIFTDTRCHELLSKIYPIGLQLTCVFEKGNKGEPDVFNTALNTFVKHSHQLLSFLTQAEVSMIRFKSLTEFHEHIDKKIDQMESENFDKYGIQLIIDQLAKEFNRQKTPVICAITNKSTLIE